MLRVCRRADREGCRRHRQPGRKGRLQRRTQRSTRVTPYLASDLCAAVHISFCECLVHGHSCTRSDSRPGASVAAWSVQALLSSRSISRTHTLPTRIQRQQLLIVYSLNTEHGREGWADGREGAPPRGGVCAGAVSAFPFHFLRLVSSHIAFLIEACDGGKDWLKPRNNLQQCQFEKQVSRECICFRNMCVDTRRS